MCFVRNANTRVQGFSRVAAPRREQLCAAGASAQPAATASPHTSGPSTGPWSFASVTAAVRHSTGSSCAAGSSQGRWWSRTRATHKRPVHEKAIDDLVNEIELEIVRAGGELSAARIGDMCLSGLGRIDQVAYLQFAAVYRQLGVEDVQAELDRLTPLTSDTPTPAKA